MSQTKKELVLAAFNNEPVDRVPVGFWYHFLANPEHTQGLGQPEVVAENMAGLKRFYHDFQPDFVKIMSDGFFAYPHEALVNLTSVKTGAEIEPLGENAPWIEEQVGLVKQATEAFGDEVLLFYTIFSAPRHLEFLYNLGDANENFVKLLREDKDAVRHILEVMSDDLAALARRVITEGKADGIYLSVQNIPRPEVTRELYEEIIAPSERKILAAANAVSDNSILHICGYEGARNDLTWYQDYEAKAISYAATVEGIDLAKGKKIFGGKAVIGGFDHTRNGVLYKGTKEEVEFTTEQIVRNAGKTGVIIGADCTIPHDINIERLHWVRNKATALSFTA